jgi:hypothetical protein
MKDKLYLLKPGFQTSPDGSPLYCSDSAPVEGVLSFFPELRSQVDVEYLAFARPRKTLVEALGEAHQSLPVLILSSDGSDAPNAPTPKVANGKRYLDDEKQIRQYLSTRYGVPQAS